MKDKNIFWLFVFLGIVLLIAILMHAFSRYELTITKTPSTMVISLHHASSKAKTAGPEKPIVPIPGPHVSRMPMPRPHPWPEETPIISEEEMADEVAHVNGIMPLVQELCAARLAGVEAHSVTECSLDALSMDLKDSQGQPITNSRLESADHMSPIMLDDKWAIYKEGNGWMLMRAPYGGNNQWFTRFIVGDSSCTLQTNGNHRKGVELMKQVFPDFTPCPRGRWCTLSIIGIS